MRKIEDNSVEKVLDAIKPFSLSQEELDAVRRYIEYEYDDPSILDKITKRNLHSFSSVELEACRKLCSSLDGRDNYMLLKFVNVLFAIGQSTANKAISGFRVRDMLNRIDIDNYKYVAICAEECAWNLYIEKQDAGIMWKLAAEKPETLVKAMDCCGLNHDNSMVYIAMSLYHNAFSRGRADKSLKKRFEDEFVPCIIDSMDVMLQGITKPEIERLKNYINSSQKLKSSIDSDILEICSRALLGDYLPNLLVSAGILTFEWSDKLARFLRICTLIDLGIFMGIAKDRFSNALAEKQLCKLEDTFPIDSKKYIIACADCKFNNTVSRLYSKNKKIFLEALEETNIQSFKAMLDVLKTIDADEFKRCSDENREVMERFRERAASNMVSKIDNGKNELYNFLIGLGDINSLTPFLNDYQKLRGSDFNNLSNTYRSICGEDEMVKRTEVVKLLIGGSYEVLNSLRSGKRYDSPLSVDGVFRLFENLEQFGMARSQQYEIVGTMYNDCYYDARKKSLCEGVAEVIYKRLGENADEETDVLKESCAAARYAAVLAYGKAPNIYKSQLLDCANDSSKLVRETLVAALAEQKDWENEIISMLGSKKSALRETAVEVIIAWGADNYTELLQKALETEKSKKLRDRIAGKLNVENSQNEDAPQTVTVERIISELNKGGKKRSLEWLYAEPLPEVRTVSGESANTETVQAIMLAYSAMGYNLGINENANLIAAELNTDDLTVFAQEVLNRWLDSGADVKKKWVLYFAAVHGGAPAAETLIQNINQWPLQARGAIAAEAVNALALSPAPSALLTVDSLSRKCKFKQVKAAAVRALKFAADELGITTEELADRIVPDLGFDSKMCRVFDYGTRKFTVRISPALDVIITDENGKKIKNLPAVGQKDDADIASHSLAEFKQMKKQMKTVVATQKLRLELALSTGRRWTTDAWKQLFISNPIMHQFSISLIWGIYEESKLIQTFRYMEDGTFNTEDEDEYELPENAVIGLVHPIELEEELLSTWKQQLEDYEVVQSVEQLNRKTYTVTEDEADAAALERFGGKILNGLSLAGKLLGLGWFKGSVEDGGMYYSYYREDVADGISVQLRFSGSYVADQDEEVTVYEAIFYCAGSVKYGSYVYDEIKKEKCIKLSDVPKHCFSEIVLQLEKATASSKETDDNWRKNKQ